MLLLERIELRELFPQPIEGRGGKSLTDSVKRDAVRLMPYGQRFRANFLMKNQCQNAFACSAVLEQSFAHGQRLMGERCGKLFVAQFIRGGRLGFLDRAASSGIAVSISRMLMLPAGKAILAMNPAVGIEDQERRGSRLGLFRKMLRRLLDD